MANNKNWIPFVVVGALVLVFMYVFSLLTGMEKLYDTPEERKEAFKELTVTMLVEESNGVVSNAEYIHSDVEEVRIYLTDKYYTNIVTSKQGEFHETLAQSAYYGLYYVHIVDKNEQVKVKIYNPKGAIIYDKIITEGLSNFRF